MEFRFKRLQQVFELVGLQGVTRLGLICLLPGITVFQADGKTLPKPDYFKGEQLSGGRFYWNLGAIGATGDIWHTRGHQSTSQTRNIKIREVFADGPADGQLIMQDVIMGVVSPAIPNAVNEQHDFVADAPKTLSKAIAEAEKKENGGKLVLKVWRPETETYMWKHPKFPKSKAVPKQKITQPLKSKIIKVTLQLPVKGAYSETAPYQCAKTEQLIKDAVAHVIKSPKFNDTRDGDSIDRALMCLGLLATGNKQYWEAVGKVVKGYNNRTPEEYRSANAWKISYQNLLATEYYLATKDAEALPIVEKLSHAIATGRSGVGTWGHGLTDLKQNKGKDYGIAPGYGAMNQVTLTCAISLVLAKKCGVQSEAVDQAIEKSTNYLRFYVEKGCLPYGDHSPGRVHNNNGSSGQAAVLYSLLGDHEASKYFATMTLASKYETEAGHTGPFFNRLWTPLGAAVSGDYGLAEFAKHNRWRTELMRTHEGAYPYQYALGQADHGKYSGWDTTGSRLLEFCLPRKQLFITGKGGYAVKQFARREVDAYIATADISTNGKSADELITQLQHWSPVVRKAAAVELAKLDEDFSGKILELFNSSNAYAWYGAAIAAQHAGRGSKDLVEALIKMTQHESTTVRYFGLAGLAAFDRRKQKEAYAKGLGAAGQDAIPQLLEMVYRDYPEEYRHWTHMYATFALFGGHSKAPLMTEAYWREKMSSKERVRLISQLLKLDNGEARSAMSEYYQYLTKEESAQLLEEIYAAVETPAPSAVMFNSGVRSNGLKLLAENEIKEGLQLGLDFLFEWGWGSWGRKQTGLVAMKPYGQHVPEKVVDELVEPMKKVRGARGREIQEVLKFMKHEPGPELITMEEFIKEFSN